MNAETIYTAAAQIIKYAVFQEGNGSTEGRNRMYNDIINNPAEWYNALEPISSAAKILVQARAAMDTKTTGPATLAALKRVLKSAPDHMKGQFEQGGKWWICDGFRLYSSPEKYPDTIPTIQSTFNAEKIMDDTRNRWSEYHAAPETVTRAALKEHKANPENKPRNKYDTPRPYAIEDGEKMVGVNAEHLLDALTLYPSATLMIAAPLMPLVMAQDGEPVALVMPVRLANPEQYRRTA